MKKTIIISVIALLLVVGIASAVTVSVDELRALMGNEQSLGGRQIISGYAVDLIGTRVGTTTAGVVFASGSATTSYPIFIGSDIKEVTYTIKNTDANAGNTAKFSLLGSNDLDCDTATTTTSFANTIVTGDINWFDIGDNFKDKVHSTSLIAATSTITMDVITQGKGRQIILTNLNYECLSLRVKASSTLYAQIKTKQNN